MSISRLTSAPTVNPFSVVTCTVWGIRLMLISQPLMESSTSLIVRLYPLTWTDPLYSKTLDTTPETWRRNPHNHSLQCGDLHGMGNKIDADLAAADVVIDLSDRKADTIDFDRPLVSQKTRQASRNFDAQFPRLANRLETADLAQSIDMARDQMAVQRIAHAQGMFQIHCSERVQAGCAIQAFARYVDAECVDT